MWYITRQENNYQHIVVEINESKTHVSRDELVEIFHAEMLADDTFPGCHRMEPYRSYFPNAGLLLPETEKLTKRVLVLPTGTAIHPEDIRKICQTIRLVAENGRETSERLRKKRM
jgi:dTDP-4-amino-4,6-dideoxygalactose transaminase